MITFHPSVLLTVCALDCATYLHDAFLSLKRTPPETMSASTTATTSTLHLPPELFLLFKTAIPVSDLRTHVCFYSAHPRLAALYDGEACPDNLWREACWLSGIGTLDEDDLSDPHCWRTIAKEVVERDGFCTHPQCGEALLEYNRQRMSHRADVTNLAAFPFVRRHAGVGEKSPHIKTTMHRVLSHIDFCDNPDGNRAQDGTMLRAADEDRAYTGSVLLRDHPLIMRSYATDVVGRALCVRAVGGHLVRAGKLTRKPGVTVLDVAAAIHYDLDTPLTSDAMIHFLMQTFDSLPPDWPGDVSLERLHTLRGLLDSSYLGHYQRQNPAFGDDKEVLYFGVELQSVYRD
ncbi:hypothetical protein C8Q77DRAFT_124679 [Trametes polyzona]|nr:hypothetical protein C8Q77DRAFT_124679 [Trametes polyzona]